MKFFCTITKFNEKFQQFIIIQYIPGAIQLKNWKPLSFDIITDDKTTTVDDILGELINSATLRIRLSRLAFDFSF